MIRIIIQVLFACTILYFIVPKAYLTQKKISLYKNLLGNNVKTKGLLEDEYTETTLKTKRNENKYYKVAYTFTVNQKKYEGYDSLLTPPTTPTVDVFYSPDNPNVNALSPYNKLENMQQGMWFAWIVLGLMLLIIMHAAYLFVKRRRKQ